MRMPVFQEAHLILAVVQRFHHARRGRPLGALRRGGHADLPSVLFRHEHGERDGLAVRRPARVGHLVGGVRDLRGGPVGIDPADEDLRAARLSVGDIENALPVGRPARVRTLGQEAMLAAIGVHDPERGIPAVLDLVGLLAGVDNARAIGRNLRIADALEVEVVIVGQTRGGRGLLGDGGESRQAYQGRRGESNIHGDLQERASGGSIQREMPAMSHAERLYVATRPTYK